METSAEKFYDDLTNIYDLMFADWPGEVKRQGKILNNLLVKYAPTSKSVLDCTCGIGTQSLGLAMNGYDVKASDISAKAVERTKAEAKSFGVSIEAKVADLLQLDKSWSGGFDAVVSFDNSLSHFQKDVDLLKAATQMRQQLKPGGLFMASIRDYDVFSADAKKDSTAKVVQQLPGEYDAAEKPQSTLPRVFNGKNGRRIVFQVWDWAADGNSYAINQFFLLPEGNGWKTIHHVTRFRALMRDQLTNVLNEAGFRNIKWLMPDESGFYQPLVVANS